MKSFRTILQPELSDFQIEHKSGVLCMGSCFAEHIGNRLHHYKFKTFLNPFGIIYNPISIAYGLEILLNKNLFFEEKDLVENLGGWHSFQHHGSFSHADKNQALEKINTALKEARYFLEDAEYLILTLGTANAFIEKKSNTTVANCHKIPQHFFIRKQLSLEEMIDALKHVLKKLNNTFPKIKIITTVSPVRHIRDGLVENQISKSKLILTLNELSKQYTHVQYFPAYELLLDDLRDYRFYKKDMIHPNEIAIDYIWDFFTKTFFTKKTTSLNSKIEKIKQAVAHRPFHPQSKEHLEFIKKQIEKMEATEKEFSFLNFDEEKKKIKLEN